jgi:hypothetical protein
MSDTKDPADELLTTRGVTSAVRDRDGDGLEGHALLMDYDDGSRWRRLLADARDLPGVTAVFRSSPEAWHVHNTTVRTLEETALVMLGTKCDPMHVSVGFRRNQWTLRIGPKTRANAAAGADADELGEEYKSAPEPLNWWVNRTDRKQSRPHMKLLASLFDAAGPGVTGGETLRDRARDRCSRWAGNEYRIETYRTMTDELKGRVDG